MASGSDLLIALVDQAKQAWTDGTAYRECRIREAAERALHDAGEHRDRESIAVTFPRAWFSQPDPAVLLDGRGGVIETVVTIPVPTILASYHEGGQLAIEALLTTQLERAEERYRRNVAVARRDAA